MKYKKPTLQDLPLLLSGGSVAGADASYQDGGITTADRMGLPPSLSHVCKSVVLVLDDFQPPRVASNGQNGGKLGTPGHGPREHQMPS